MKKIVIEFCNGTKVEATTVREALLPVLDFFNTLPATEKEKERYMKEFDEAAEKALVANSNVIVYDPFIRIKAVEVED